MLFSAIKNQYKIAVLLNAALLVLAVLFVFMRGGIASMMLANFLLGCTVLGGFSFDKKSGELLKLPEERFFELLFMAAIIGGLHIFKYNQQVKWHKMKQGWNSAKTQEADGYDSATTLDTPAKGKGAQKG